MPLVGRPEHEGRRRGATGAGRGKTQGCLVPYHAPPDGSPTSWGGSRHYGDTDVVGWIDRFKPDAVLCGHIHQAPFKTGGSWIDRIGSTWIFNSGQQIGPTPAHVIIDTEAQAAAWFSLAGAELAQLDAPLQRPVPELTSMPVWLARPQ